MERIISSTNSKLKKQKAKNGEIQIRDKKNGKEARVTLQLNIPGVKNPRLAKYGATEDIARKRLAEAILLVYIKVQKSKEFANIQVFSPECQEELNKFDEYMECVKEQQSNVSKKNSETINDIKYPLSTYVYKMLKEKKKESEIVKIKRKKKITPTTITYYLNTAKTKVLPIFRRNGCNNINKRKFTRTI